MSTPAANVIWERTIDREIQRQRWRRLLRWYVVPVVVLAAVFAITLGVGAALGLLIVAGLFGLLLTGWLWITNLNERSGATIRFDGRRLGWRAVTIDVEAVSAFSTYSGKMAGPLSASSSWRSGNRIAIDCGYARFRMADGSTAEFMWPNMPPDQVDGVRHALDRVLPGRWQPMSDL